MRAADVAETKEVPVADFDERYLRLRLPQPRLTVAIAESMQRYGQLSPVVACEREAKLAVVDGFRRLSAARKLGFDAMRVSTLPLTERAAVAAVFGLNLGSRGLVDLEEVLVVRELVREHGLTQPEVGELLGHDKSWVCRRLMLVERLCEEVQNDVRVGLIPLSVAREVARLPRGNQPEVAGCVLRHGLSSRDAAQLVRLHEQTTNRSEQEALLASPQTALEAARGSPRYAPNDPRLGSAGNQLRRQALLVAEGLARLDRILPQRAVAEWSEPERHVLGELLGRVSVSAIQVGRQAEDVSRAMQASAHGAGETGGLPRGNPRTAGETHA